MLFTGLLACFSPTVPADIRVLWVRHGGYLTHTASDFYNAMFFFCDGTDDPWLSELLSRYLIVRHAAWVTRCVSENFYMPIASYTLDDGFDESRILILDPSTFVAKATSHSGGPPRSTKRKVSEDDDRIPEPAIERKSIRQKILPMDKIDDTGDDTLIETDVNLQGKPPQFISFDFATSRRRGKLSRTVKTFEACISRVPPKTPVETPKQNHGIPAPLTPHAVYWNEVFAKANGSTPLMLSMDDLLRAPPTKSAIFDVNHSYLGRRFINNDQEI